MSNIRILNRLHELDMLGRNKSILEGREFEVFENGWCLLVNVAAEELTLKLEAFTEEKVYFISHKDLWRDLK